MTGFCFTFDDDGTPSIQITGTGKAFGANYGGLLIASALTAAVSIRETAYQTLTPRMELTRTTGLRLNFDHGLLYKVSLPPDIDTVDTGVSITGDIYLRGNVNDIFTIIQIVKHLTQATGKNVILFGVAQQRTSSISRSWGRK
jgi:hypothetical protein